MADKSTKREATQTYVLPELGITVEAVNAEDAATKAKKVPKE